LNSNARRWIANAVFLVLGLVLGAVWQPLLSSLLSEDTVPSDHPELARLYADDQADRRPAPGQALDWKVVGARDRAREAKVKELLASDAPRTGADFFHAAMVLQHGSSPEDYLLAHELSVLAIGQGERRARWLAAASMDRYLMNIGRPQRFATQYRSEGPALPMTLYLVDEQVTDTHRAHFGAPPLREAKEREAMMNRE
jgi:hypothetical protein